MEPNPEKEKRSEVVTTIKVSQIDFGKRYRKDYGNLDVLKDKIERIGIIQPIAVKDKGDGTYLLLAGGRRFMAWKLLEREEIPARVFPEELTSLMEREIELSENIDRQDLKPSERWLLEAAIHRLEVEKAGGEKVSKVPGAPGHSLRDTAKMLGQSPTTTAMRVKLGEIMESSPELREAFESCKTDKEGRQLLSSIGKSIQRARMVEDAKKGNIDEKKKVLIDNFRIGDVFEGLAKEPNESFDFVEIDPPYATDIKHSKKSMTQAGALTLSEYNEIPVDDYPKFISDLLTLTYQKQKNNTWLLIWFAIQHYHTIYTTLIDSGYKVWRVPAIWAKPGGQTQQPTTNLGSAYELFFYARKGDAIISKQGHSNVFKFSPVSPIGARAKIHPTERPIELIAELMTVFMEPKSNQHVLTPFAGSGNTILAAANLSHTCIGWDLSEEYKVGYTQRVLEGRPPLYKSY